MMKRFRNISIALLAGALLLTGFASNAIALTEACTPISNQATLTYSVGAVPQPTIDSEDTDTGGATVFDVATKVDLTVTGGTALAVVPGATDRVLTYSITNTGNDQQRYNLRVWAAAGTETVSGHTDNFDMDNVDVYTDDDNDYTTGTPTQIAAGAVTTDGSNFSGYTAVVEPGATIWVHLVADVPIAQVNNDAAVYALEARTHQPIGLTGVNIGDGTDGGETDETSTTNGCGNVVVLADGDDGGPFEAGGTDLDDAANNGAGYAVGVYYVSSATISVTKSQVPLWDPINGNSSPKPIPGAYVTYTLTISNDGGSSAILSTIIDDLQVDLNLDPNLFDGTSMTPLTGPYASAAGDSVFISHGGISTRADSYGTAADSATDQDGIEYTGDPGGVITVYFTDPGGEGSVLQSGGGYQEGELKTGESVSISFNAIIL